MSDISEKVRNGMYSALNVASVVGTGKATAIYYANAPEDAVLPYVVFNRTVPGRVERPVLSSTIIIESDRWDVKCIADEDSSTTKDPQEIAQDILSLCESALGSLSISGNTLEYHRRDADIPGFRELVNDRYVYHEGFVYLVKVS